MPGLFIIGSLENQRVEIRINMLTRKGFGIKWSSCSAEQKEYSGLRRRGRPPIAQAPEGLAKLREVALAAYDIERVLILATLRATLNENMNQLQVISSQVQTHLMELEQLTIQGRRLTRRGAPGL